MSIVKTAIAVSLLVIMLFSVPGVNGEDPSPEFHNEIGMNFTFECPRGHAFSSVQTNYTLVPVPDPVGRRRKRNRVGDVHDSRWLWSCKKLSAYRKDFCEWFRNINSPEDLILFQCPKNAFMAGVESAYDPGSFDRVWGVKCCRVLGLCTRDCCLSDYINTPGEDINYSPEDDSQFFTGMFGPWVPGAEDRLWKLEQCKSAHCGSFHYHKSSHYWKK